MSTNERAWLSACIGSLTKSKLADLLELEVVLVDNASTDGSADFVERLFSNVRVLRNPANLGFAGANNVGIADALARGSDHVLLVNPDTITPPDLVLRLVQFMAEWPEYGIVGPLQYTYPADCSPSSELNAWSSSALEAGERHVFYLDWPDHTQVTRSVGRRAPNTLEHAYVQGSALLCRAEVFRDIGLFDTAYHTYYEEVDLCRRARYAGWRVALLLDLGIRHRGEGGTAASLYRRQHMQRNKYYFLFTDPEWPVHEAARLAGRWIRNDLCGRGSVPAPTLRAAAGDTVLGLTWLATRAPLILRRRRVHRSMLERGPGAATATHAEPGSADHGDSA